MFFYRHKKPQVLFLKFEPAAHSFRVYFLGYFLPHAKRHKDDTTGRDKTMRDQHGDEDNTKQDKDERKTGQRRETKTKQKRRKQTKTGRDEDKTKTSIKIISRNDVCMILGLRATCYYYYYYYYLLLTN